MCPGTEPGSAVHRSRGSQLARWWQSVPRRKGLELGQGFEREAGTEMMGGGKEEKRGASAAAAATTGSERASDDQTLTDNLSRASTSAFMIMIR
ncbi:hypothetical protein AXG93_4012s1300 [Marchantia polymorpha subsp. ruderalis]|uniref:Uncharacterized protein n=1 Tax=Marchantia polymorpha subsp. ruderalis TaxID=1480154 RepID=A0A176VJS4_MARPO|nr:hypothetical protein AXG93_4012s1300 [Marchantia polymorpha subsp. ruderalis]